MREYWITSWVKESWITVILGKSRCIPEPLSVSFKAQISWTNFVVRTWVSKSIYIKQQDMIIHQRPNFKGGLIKSQLHHTENHSCEYLPIP